MDSMIRQGIALGLETICFTEHYDPDFPDIPSGHDFSLNFDAYYDECRKLADRYAGRIEVLHGIELGIQPHLKDELADFIDQYGSRYDYIIASCHLVDRMDIYYPGYFETWGPQGGLRRYFETTYRNLQIFDSYQAVGHLDYASRYIRGPRLPFHYKEYQDILDAILLHIISHDKALEVNSSGLKAGLDWPNPHMDILKRYKDLGGSRITIGSDGHQPAHMAYDFHRLPAILKEAGFDHYEVYRKQKASQVPLTD